MREPVSINPKKILITGASGLIGSRLTELLIAGGHSVAHLGRSKRPGQVSTFVWDPSKGTIDLNAFEKIDAIIHLAGAGIADKRWSAARKKEIMDSRVKSTELLYQTLKNNPHRIQTLVSASAIGYYGFGGDDRIFTEDDDPGNDFLALVTRQWEAEVDKLGLLGLRLIKIRIGIVLSEKGGALKEMGWPIRLGFGSALGTGQQFLSWIHLDDLCAIFVEAIENDSMKGPYNAVTDCCTNEEMTKAIARALHKPLWLPSVPAFVLKIILGEMADIVLMGSKVSSEKIRQAGFRYQFPNLNSALNNLLA